MSYEEIGRLTYAQFLNASRRPAKEQQSTTTRSFGSLAEALAEARAKKKQKRGI